MLYRLTICTPYWFVPMSTNLSLADVECLFWTKTLHLWKSAPFYIHFQLKETLHTCICTISFFLQLCTFIFTMRNCIYQELWIHWCAFFRRTINILKHIKTLFVAYHQGMLSLNLYQLFIWLIVVSWMNMIINELLIRWMGCGLLHKLRVYLWLFWYFIYCMVNVMVFFPIKMHAIIILDKG